MIRYALEQDVKNCVAMMELVKDDFAGYKEKEFLEALHKSIPLEESILAVEHDTVAGMLSFSHMDKEITFLAVHPDYRKKGIARELIEKAKNSFPMGEELHVITFQDGDPKGVAARNCYSSCGFVEDEKLEIYGYPCQKLICRID